RLRREGHAAVTPHWAAGIAGAGTAGALLTPGLLGGVADLALGERALRALALIGEIVLDGCVEDGLVRLDAENGLGEGVLADLFACHIVNDCIGHCVSLLSLASGRPLLRVGADGG